VRAVKFLISILVSAQLLFLSGCGESVASTAQKNAPVRLGYFANLTHAQALIGLQRGDFQKALGDTPLESKCFNAGPATVEAIFAGEIDIAYVGPSPALNAFIKSRGKAVRVISGSAANGVTIVASKDSGITALSQLAGKKISTPQFGNTQDVSARHYLKNVLKAKLVEDGGDTEIFTIANAEQVSLLRLGKLDAAWTPEPWASRMINEAGARLIAEEKDLWEGGKFCTVVLIASTRFLNERPEAAKAFLSVHAEITTWINNNPDSAAKIVNGQLKEHLGKGLSEEVLKNAFSRVVFTTDPLKDTIRQFAEHSHELGFIKEQPDLVPMFWEASAGDKPK
jgi:NitT/TauT family transport system substrate-binding protein